MLCYSALLLCYVTVLSYYVTLQCSPIMLRYSALLLCYVTVLSYYAQEQELSDYYAIYIQVCISNSLHVTKFYPDRSIRVY